MSRYSRSTKAISLVLLLLPCLTAYDRSTHVYEVPAVTLTDQAGHPVRLEALLNTRDPIVLQFIFTTCSTVCPIMTATLSAAAPQLTGAHFISISIDPENDTPAGLAAYASRFHAPSSWTFLTGQAADIVAVQRAFDAEPSTIMTHRPLTFLRAPGAAPNQWVRLDGLSTAADLVAEYRRAIR